MIYAVIQEWDTGQIDSVTLFTKRDKAKAYLHWLWEDTYNDFISDYEMDEDCYEECYHEDEFAHLKTPSGKCMRFLLEKTDAPADEFEEIDWSRYL